MERAAAPEPYSSERKASAEQIRLKIWRDEIDASIAAVQTSREALTGGPRDFFSPEARAQRRSRLENAAVLSGGAAMY